MCLALGGHVSLLSSTYEDCSIHARAIDAAGPLAGIAAAILFWAWLRFLTPRGAATRAFLCFGFAFTAFWNVGYMIKSGILDSGDWAFVIAGLEPAPLWHAALVAAGIVLYAAGMRILAGLLRKYLAGEDGDTPFVVCLIAYLAAGIAASLAGYFDPRGAMTVITDAMPSAFGSIGLAWTGFVVSRRSPSARIAIAPSPAWMVAGVAAGVALIAVLGPGLRF